MFTGAGFARRATDPPRRDVIEYPMTRYAVHHTLERHHEGKIGQKSRTEYRLWKPFPTPDDRTTPDQRDSTVQYAPVRERDSNRAVHGTLLRGNSRKKAFLK